MSEREDAIFEDVLDGDRRRIRLRHFLVSLSVSLLLRFRLSSFFSEFKKLFLALKYSRRARASTNVTVNKSVVLSQRSAKNIVAF